MHKHEDNSLISTHSLSIQSPVVSSCKVERIIVILPKNCVVFELTVTHAYYAVCSCARACFMNNWCLTSLCVILPKRVGNVHNNDKYELVCFYFIFVFQHVGIKAVSSLSIAVCSDWVWM